MKKSLNKVVLTLALFLLSATAVYAITPSVSISNLNEYTKSDNFNLSYSAISDNPESITAKFYFRKDGDSYQQFGSTISGASGQIQVTGTQVGEENKYYFKVEINGGAASDETNVTYDISGPDAVQGFSVENLGGGHYKLRWRNPNNDDFSRVFLYRSDDSSFTADPSTKMGERGGAKDAEATYEVFGLDPDKAYYFAARSVDKAGNTSGIVSNVPGTIDEGTSVTQLEAEGEVSQLPSEGDGGGSVLGEEDEDEATDSADGEGDEGMMKAEKERTFFERIWKFIVDKTKVSLGIAVAVAVLAYGVYWYFIKKD